jgi:hypothetical protein
VWIVPADVPYGAPVNPVTELPAQTPTSLSVVLGPWFVTSEPARTEKFAALPRLIVAGPAALAVRPAVAPIATMSAMPIIAATIFEFFILEAPCVRARTLVASISVGWWWLRSRES